MTAIVLKSYSFIRTGFISAIASWMLGHLTAMHKAVHASRAMSANETIARLMLHEYPEHTYASLLAELNRKTLQEIYNA